LRDCGQQVHEADKQFIFCLFSFSCRSFIGERKTLSKHVSKLLFSSAQDHLSTFFYFVWENCTTKTEKSMTLFYLLIIQGAKNNTQHTVDANCKPEIKNLIMYVPLSLLHAIRSFEVQI
jgi:hypothetical protein